MSYINHRKRRHHPWLPMHWAPQTLSTAALLTSFSLTLPTAKGQSQPVDEAITDLAHVRVKAKRLKEYSADKPASGKMMRALVDTPQTIAVFNHALLQEQKAATLTQALQNSPGVSTFFAGENATSTTGDTIYMRGFDSSSSIFVDGIRDVGAISRDMFNTDRVEITKGPSGPDYGRTAPAGAINLVTKQPILQNKQTINLSYGSAAQRRVTGDVNTVLGRDAALRLNVVGQDSGLPGRDYIKNRHWGVATAAGFGLGTATSFLFDLSHIQQNNIPDGNVPTIGLPGSHNPNPTRTEFDGARPVRSNHFYGTTSDFDHNTEDSMTLRVVTMLTDASKLENTTRWGRNTQAYMLTAFTLRPDNFPPAGITVTSDPSTWTVGRNYPTFKQQTNRIWTNQTNLNLHLTTGRLAHELAAGLELIDEQQQGQGITAVGSLPPANLYFPNPHIAVENYLHVLNRGYQNGRTRTVGTYLFDNIDISEHWQIDTGLRWDGYRTETSARYCVNRASGGRIYCSFVAESDVADLITPPRQSVSDVLFSWKAGVVFKLSHDTSLYANYAVSQQPPGGASIELSTNVKSQDNPLYRPQTGSSRELGFKSQLLDHQLLVTAALYSTKVANQVSQNPMSKDVIVNAKTQVTGMELSAVGNVTDQWTLSAGWTMTHSRVLNTMPLTADGSPQLAYTPSRAFTAWSSYETAHGLTVGLGPRYVGPLKRAADNAIGSPPTIAGYWVVDGMVSYALQNKWLISLNGYNLFDRQYVAAINKSGYRYTPGMPRSFLLTLTRDL